MENKIHIAENSHWYTKDGLPCYEVPNASKPGEMRKTTLRDAKLMDLYVSVTTVLGILDKPMLNRWKQEQMLYASLTLPRGTMSEEQWINAIIDDSKQQSVKAMDLGTQVHAAIQGSYEGIEPSPEFKIYVDATKEIIYKEFSNQPWVAEKSFAHPLRYGGKVDLFCPICVLDFKTTSLNGEKLKKAGYDDHAMQLAAYRLGLRLERASLCNVYISTTVPGEVYLKIWSEEESLLAAQKWIALLGYWKLDKRF